MYKDAIIEYIVLLWVCVIFWAVISITIYKKCLKKKDKDYKLGRITLLIFAIIVLCYGFYKSALCIVDITTEAYVVEEVNYSKHQQKHIFIEDPVYVTTNDGTTVSLAGGRSYPYGEYSGVVTYSKHSRIILEFTIKKLD